MQNTAFQEFIHIIENKSKQEDIIKITLSKVRSKSSTLLNVFIKAVIIKKKWMYSCIYHSKTSDLTKNVQPEELAPLLENLLTDQFLNADCISSDEIITLLQNKKSNSRLIRKKQKTITTEEPTHDRNKLRMVKAERPYLHLLGLTDSEGNVFDKSQKKFRQINKFIEIIEQLLKENEMYHFLKIADMGSGKGYLSFALYDYLTNNKNIKTQLTGYEIRPDLISKCNEIAQKLHFEDLFFVQNDISNIDLPKTDMVIALHACDIATDMAIAKGIEADAQFIIVAPCCHKQIRKDMKSNNALSPMLSHGILLERQAEIITDGLRALIMQYAGYKTQVFEFISTEHTAKNIMITGIKSKSDSTALVKVKRIKADFGIEYHYLEKLLNI